MALKFGNFLLELPVEIYELSDLLLGFLLCLLVRYECVGYTLQVLLHFLNAIVSQFQRLL